MRSHQFKRKMERGQQNATVSTNLAIEDKVSDKLPVDSGSNLTGKALCSFTCISTFRVHSVPGLPGTHWPASCLWLHPQPRQTLCCPAVSAPIIHTLGALSDNCWKHYCWIPLMQGGRSVAHHAVSSLIYSWCVRLVVVVMVTVFVPEKIQGQLVAPLSECRADTLYYMKNCASVEGWEAKWVRFISSLPVNSVT